MCQTQLQIDTTIQKILDKLTILKNDICSVIQKSVSSETAVEYINKSFEFCYYEVVYQLNKCKASISSINCDICENNFESLLAEKLQKAEHIIHLQTLSTMLSAKVSNLVANNQKNK